MGSAGLRYGLKTDRFSSHSQIARWLQDFKRLMMPGHPCVVYDIGCAQGLLGQLLDPDVFLVFGVDSDPVALRQAGPNYRQALCADIESTASFGFAELPDVLVLADVLEHTREPEECLRRLSWFKRKGWPS